MTHSVFKYGLLSSTKRCNELINHENERKICKPYWCCQSIPSKPRNFKFQKLEKIEPSILYMCVGSWYSAGDHKNDYLLDNL